jgi:hypothetical protein
MAIVGMAMGDANVAPFNILVILLLLFSEGMAPPPFLRL